MHALLLNRLPRGAARPPAPVIVMLAADPAGAPAAAPVPEETEPAGTDAAPQSRRSTVPSASAARAGGPGAVQRLLARTRGLAPGYADLLRGEAARILFTLNRDEEAYALVCPAPRACRQPAFAAAVRRRRQPGWRRGGWSGLGLPCRCSRRPGGRS